MPRGGERDSQQEQRRRPELLCKCPCCTEDPVHPIYFPIPALDTPTYTDITLFTQIYVALFPCNECAKLIIQSGIAEVVYLSDKYKDTPSMMASRRMMTMAGVSA